MVHFILIERGFCRTDFDIECRPYFLFPSAEDYTTPQTCFSLKTPQGCSLRGGQWERRGCSDAPLQPSTWWACALGVGAGSLADRLVPCGHLQHPLRVKRTVQRSVRRRPHLCSAGRRGRGGGHRRAAVVALAGTRTGPGWGGGPGGGLGPAAPGPERGHSLRSSLWENEFLSKLKVGSSSCCKKGGKKTSLKKEAQETEPAAGRLLLKPHEARCPRHLVQACLGYPGRSELSSPGPTVQAHPQPVSALPRLAGMQDSSPQHVLWESHRYILLIIMRSSGQGTD